MDSVHTKDFVPEEHYVTKENRSSEDFEVEEVPCHVLDHYTTGPTVPITKKVCRPIEHTQEEAELSCRFGENAYGYGGYQEAINHCEKAITYGLDNCVPAYLIIAKSCYFLNNYRKAIFYFKKVLETETKDHSVYLFLAKCYVGTEEFMLALSNYKKAYKFDETDVECLIGMGYCFQKQDDLESAEKILREALYKCKNQKQTEYITAELYDIYHDIGEKYRAAGEYRKAAEVWLKALTLPGLSPKEKARIHVDAGECLSDLGNFAEAKKNFDAALRYDSLNPYAYLGLAHIHLKQWEIDKAKACYDQYLRYVEQDTEEERETVTSVNALTRALTGIKNRSYQQALSSAEKISNVRNDLAAMRKNLIPFILLKMGRYEEIITRIKPQIYESDTSVTATVCLGVAYCREGKSELALQYLSSCEKDGFAQSGINGWAYKGDALFNLKQYKEAIVAYQKALVFIGPKEFVEYPEDYFECRIKKSRELFAEMERKISPHITIHGDHNPVNIGGIQATDNAIINKPGVSSTTYANRFCSNCGAPLKPNAKYCSSCGEKVE